MVVAGHEQGVLRRGKRQKVVVSRVSRPEGRRAIWVWDDGRRAGQPLEKTLGFIDRDPPAQLGVGEGALKLGQ